MDLHETFAAVQAASRQLLTLDDTEINRILLAVADAAIARTDFILEENRKDLERMLLKRVNLRQKESNQRIPPSFCHFKILTYKR